MAAAEVAGGVAGGTVLPAQATVQFTRGAGSLPDAVTVSCAVVFCGTDVT